MTSNPEHRNIRQDVHASGAARVYQAAGDQYVETHLYFGLGVERTRRVETGTVAEVSPYPTDMAAFRPEDAEWFFGRDRVLAELLEELDQRLRRGGGPVAVVAPSGAGKSSLLQAGLIPRLEQGALPGSRDWPGLRLTPTGRPILALAAAMSGLTGAPAEQVAQELWANPNGYIETLRRYQQQRMGDSLSPRVRLIVLVDQLEELFTLCDDEGERHRFLDVLSRLADPGPAGQEPLALVVYALRADFYARCAEYPQLRTALRQNPVVLGPMSPSEVQQAILYPAQRAGLRVEAGLVDLLLRDLGAATADGTVDETARGYEAGRLPLLAHALRATWRERHGQTLTVDGYRLTGGIEHAVATTAERTFAALTPVQQRAARTLFLRLIKIGEGTEDARQLVLRTDLLGDDTERREALAAVLDAFTRDRLLTQGAYHVEITHEALLRAWPRLRGWINEDRSGNLIRQQLHDAAAAWDRDGRDSSALYRGSRLQTARDWLSSAEHADLRPTDAAFIEASIRHRQRAVRTRRSAVAALSFLTVVSLFASLVAVRQLKVATAQRNTAIFNQINTQADRFRLAGAPGAGNSSLAAELKLAAYRRLPPGSTEKQNIYTTLINTENTPLSTVLAGGLMAFSGDQRTLSTSNEGTVRLWDITDPTQPVPLGPPYSTGDDLVNVMAFSPDQRTLASGSGDGTVRLWNVTDPARPVPWGPPLTTATDLLNGIEFTPDGHTLVTADQDSTVRLWNVTDPARPVPWGPPLTGYSSPVHGVTLSPDGKTLATGSEDGTVRLWNVTDPANPVPLGQPFSSDGGAVFAVAFSPDGNTLATGDLRNTVHLWNVTRPANPTLWGAPLTGADGEVDSVAFSPDGTTLAAGSSDTTVRLWTVPDPAHPQPWGPALTGHADPVSAVLFSPDGKTLASAGGNGGVRLWAMPDTVLPSGSDIVFSEAFTPDGRTLATGDADHTVRLWDVRDPAHPAPIGEPLTSPSGYVTSVAFSPDGTTLAAGTSDGTVQLWNMTNKANPVPWAAPFTAHTGEVYVVAFSPDGRTLATGNDGTVDLWNLTDLADPVLWGSPVNGSASYGRSPASYIRSVTFSPDGRTLAAGTGEGLVWLWNVRDPAHPAALGRPLGGLELPVDAVTFSPDGQTLAAGAGDGAVWLWNVTNPARPVLWGPPSMGHTSAVDSVAFSPDGKTLASGGEDNTVRLWNVTDRTRVTPLGEPLSGYAGGVYSVVFSPDGRTLATGAADYLTRLWQLDLEHAVRRICDTTRKTLTPAVWNQYISGVPYDPPCAT